GHAAVPVLLPVPVPGTAPLPRGAVVPAAGGSRDVLAQVAVVPAQADRVGLAEVGEPVQGGAEAAGRGGVRGAAGRVDPPPPGQLAHVLLGEQVQGGHLHRPALALGGGDPVPAGGLVEGGVALHRRRAGALGAVLGGAALLDGALVPGLQAAADPGGGAGRGVHGAHQAAFGLDLELPAPVRGGRCGGRGLVAVAEGAALQGRADLPVVHRAAADLGDVQPLPG